MLWQKRQPFLPNSSFAINCNDGYKQVIYTKSLITIGSDSNIKTATNASNREVNIIVLMNGTLDVSGLTGPNTPFTLTSLYKGYLIGSNKIEITLIFFIYAVLQN